MNLVLDVWFSIAGYLAALQVDFKNTSKSNMPQLKIKHPRLNSEGGAIYSSHWGNIDFMSS